MKNNKNSEFDKVEFYYPSFSETISSSLSQISNQYLHSPYISETCSGGLINFKLGAFDNFPCKTCGKSFKQCSGHFGFLKLFLPVFNIGYIKAIHGILQIICKNCSRMLLKKDKEYEKILKIIRILRKKDKISRTRSLSLIVEHCRRQKWCPHCFCKNGKVRKIGAWNFIYELEVSETSFPHFFGAKYNNFYEKEIILNPLKVFFLLQRINRCDFEILDLDPSGTKPESFILSILPIPPLSVRPTVSISSKITNEDDLTVRLVEIYNLNSKIKKLFFCNQQSENLWEYWSILQIECARYLDSEIFIGDLEGKNLSGIYQRLKGKNGRFRGSLGGKRVDFSGRTVISPDPNLELNLVGIPISIALKLTLPEKITKFNRERLKRTVIRGSNIYPGANYLIGPNWKRNLVNNFNTKISFDYLKEGNIIDRHIKDNDIILFNRQPSLHRISIMAHRVKVMTGKTFRFNECVCKPYNADFDGDEMNIHVPQTQKAKAEAICLMNPIGNFKTPRNGEPLVAATQDFLTFLYLLTSKDSFFSYSELFRITGFFYNEKFEENLFSPTILKPKVLWTGKQLFSLIFFSNKSTFIQKNQGLNLSNILEEKNYSLNEKQCSPFMCPFDGWIILKNNQLLSGRIGKISIGSGNKNSLICSMENKLSTLYAATALFNISKITYNWFSQFGFTICLYDIIPTFKKKISMTFLNINVANLNSALKVCKSSKLINNPFLGEKEEAKIKKVLSKIRLKIGSVFLSKKQYRMNPLQLMFLAGSKGSLLNLSQMVLCLGQQTVDGKRINGKLFETIMLKERNKVIDSDILKNGFVKKSFIQGLDNLEFFFHAMAGREGLVDTAVKTSETGYIQRKLSKNLEDVVVFYDSTVRTVCGRLIQFNYGDDNLNPEKSSIFSQILNFQQKKNIKIINENPQKFKYLEIEIFVKSHFLLFKIPNLFINSYRTKFLNFNQKNYIFLEITLNKIEYFIYSRTKILNNVNIEPGAGVGAIAAQSIGEPCTQMTLQTFHSAGTGCMNITLGVPRINEIMNVSRVSQNSKIIFTHPSTGNKLKLMKLKIHLYKIPLNKIMENITVSFQKQFIATIIKFKKEFLFLSGIADVYYFICEKLKNSKEFGKYQNLLLNRNSGEVKIIWSNTFEKKKIALLKAYNLLNFCKFNLPEQAFSGKLEPKNLHFFSEKNLIRILFNGENLEEIINLPFIDFISTQSNNFHKINLILGIEAARYIIIKEIEKTFLSNGIFTDIRHLILLADVITNQGELIGITRHGLPRMKSNTLALASFEKTVDNLFSAASISSRDLLTGTSENIILGKESPVGTGLVTLRNLI